MNPAQLNGLTPEELYEKIQESSSGFSLEDDHIQYLGWEIRLKDGKAVLSEQSQNPRESKSMLDRLISMQPDLKNQLSLSKVEALQKIAKEMVKKEGRLAVKKASIPELKYAVAFEYIVEQPRRIMDINKEVTSFSQAQKYRLISTVQQRSGTLFRCIYYKYLELDVIHRFKLVKDCFQLPQKNAIDTDNGLYEQEVMCFDRTGTFESGLRLLQQLLEAENNEVARKLMPEVDKIREQFSSRVNADGELNSLDMVLFRNFADRLLYLVAACSAFSDKADADELVYHITSVLKDHNHDSIRHIARELAFLSKQPRSVSYSRYVDATNRILKDPSFTVKKHGHLKQLIDTRGFGLLEGHKTLTPYMTALRELLKTVPEYAGVLRPEIEAIEQDFGDITPDSDSFPSQRQAAKKRVHRLLLVIAACSHDPRPNEAPFRASLVKAVMQHKDYKNVLYLVSGLACLVQNPEKIEGLLGTDDVKIGGNHLLLAPLGLVRLLCNGEKIPGETLKKVCSNLNYRALRLKIKDSKVFHQWLATLDNILADSGLDKETAGEMLETLTSSANEFYEKLVLINMLFMQNSDGSEALQLLGLGQGTVKDDLLRIVKEGSAALSQKGQAASQWLLQQRSYHLLPVYLQKIRAASNDEIPEQDRTELISLIHQFLEASVNDTFVECRQSPENNPHLHVVYQRYPTFINGWGANFSGFSQSVTGKLKSGETLELTEKPWDLFISGAEIKSCQSPYGCAILNCALMSYVMDGRNAMIVKKNQKGNIIGRAVIRIVLNNQVSPALFIEPLYGVAKNDNEPLFMEAAQEVALQMNLSLYKKGDTQDSKQMLTMLEGRAPFDYFDSISTGCSTRRARIVLKGVSVE